MALFFNFEAQSQFFVWLCNFDPGLFFDFRVKNSNGLLFFETVVMSRLPRLFFQDLSQNPSKSGGSNKEARFWSRVPNALLYQLAEVQLKSYSLKNKSSFEFWTQKSNIGLDQSYKATQSAGFVLKS